MNQPFHFQRTPLIAIALAAFAWSTPAFATDLNTRLGVQQSASEVVLGQTMFDYYQGNNFAALSQVMLGKAIGRIDNSVTASELVLGDLYVDFGMPDEADNVFSYIATRDMRTETRNETQFRKGRLQYRQGEFFEAERILSQPLSTELTRLEIERRIMLATVFMARNEFGLAIEALAPIVITAPLGAYATYNNGVAHLRAQRTAEGIDLLQQVLDLPVGDDEINALKDRAALAIGFNYLQQKSPGEARNILNTVRLKGPFSNAALLALGHSYFERKEYKRALSFWLELLARSPSDASVQEAMIFVPRAYEALNATQQAFSGYQVAIHALDNQIAEIGKLAVVIKADGWIDSLNPSITGTANEDPMALSKNVIPTDNHSIALLYRLFAESPFNEGLRQYQQLLRLKHLMSMRNEGLASMRDMAAFMQKRQLQLPALSARVSNTSNRIKAISERWPILEKRARQSTLSHKNISSGNNLKSMERQYKLAQMEEWLAKRGDSPTIAALKNRIRTLKGVLLLETASKAPPSQEQIYADIASNEAQLQLTQVRLAALQQLLADNQKIASRNNAATINTLQTRIASTQKSLDTALAQYRIYLQKLAENQLDDTRTRINQDLAEAHLSLARLQDATLQRDDKSPSVEKARP